jgi:hypothetical protein
MEEQKPWYETEEDRVYAEAITSIKAAVEGGASFDEAASGLDVKDKALRDAVVSDALKVLIAEMHLMGKTPIEELAGKLGLPLEKLEQARKEMMADLEAAAIEKYKESLGQEGNA